MCWLSSAPTKVTGDGSHIKYVLINLDLLWGSHLVQNDHVAGAPSRNTVQCFATHQTPAKETDIGRQYDDSMRQVVGSLPASDSWSSHQGCVHCCAGLQPFLYSRTKPTLTFLQVSCPCSCKHQGHKILLITLQLLTKWVWLAKGGHTASALMSRQLITVKPSVVTYSRLPKKGAVYLLPCLIRVHGVLYTEIWPLAGTCKPSNSLRPRCLAGTLQLALFGTRTLLPWGFHNALLHPSPYHSPSLPQIKSHCLKIKAKRSKI